MVSPSSFQVSDTFCQRNTCRGFTTRCFRGNGAVARNSTVSSQIYAGEQKCRNSQPAYSNTISDLQRISTYDLHLKFGIILYSTVRFVLYLDKNLRTDQPPQICVRFRCRSRSSPRNKERSCNVRSSHRTHLPPSQCPSHRACQPSQPQQPYQDSRFRIVCNAAARLRPRRSPARERSAAKPHGRNAPPHRLSPILPPLPRLYRIHPLQLRNYSPKMPSQTSTPARWPQSCSSTWMPSRSSRHPRRRAC